ncbi:hypothetical protein N7448_011123 [Penicillium atrosanguineum]|uniref:Aminoglycoside phosphotransferase domain-containing protein n=1 Tax=Penicillium atrosanguineum TaxID=1132637 RepID=A0A9W9U6X5_9EURO|nr:hypothetical protein N7448_011123 [Penicillium atrosanguineum]KAJ5318282.1 hypothetical protein N7476_004702 [Penicillium atrosanguineum]
MDYLNWKSDISHDSTLPHIDWDALTQYAISIKCGWSENAVRSLDCIIPPIYSMGGAHLVRLLIFEDGTKWVARIQLQKQNPHSKILLLSEKHTLGIIHERTAIPVPKVVGYDDCEERIGRAFMIMEFIPGSTAMNAFGGPQVHGGAIPQRYKAKFHGDIAYLQTNMTSVRFPKIGMISQRENGSYDIDPIPGIGGPFRTAQDFFLAWADNAKFPTAEALIRSQLSQLPLDVVEEIILSIHQFPVLFKEAVRRMSFSQGPFPLHHPDFNHSNVIIDDAYGILSVIDWEGASTVPWEIVEFPMFLYTVPPPIDLPSKYDPTGYPINPEIQKRWEERQNYVELVKRVEKGEDLDCKLSATLACRDTQNLATSVRLYADVGKVGYYCRLLGKIDRPEPYH